MSIKGGYILQPRSIDESDVSRFPPHVREIWLYLLRKANHAEALVSGTIIKRGQLMTSYKEIIDDLSWSVGYRKMSYKKHHCETAMKLLTKERMITTTKTTRGLIITICKYEYYQTPENYETYDGDHKKTTRKPQSTDRINKKNKNDKKKNTLGDTSPEKLHTRCKNYFLEKYEELFGENYYWDAKDGANLNPIIKKITFNRKVKKLPIDDDSLLSAFEIFINSIKDNWLLSNFSIPNINSKFNEIVSQAKSNNNGRKKQQSNTSDEELLASIKAGIQRGIKENSIE